MLGHISKKSLFITQFWIILNVIFELISSLIIGVSIANLFSANDTICFTEYCFSKIDLMVSAFVFFILHPIIHSVTLFKILQETNLVGMNLCNGVLLQITNSQSKFDEISDDEKLKITTVEAQRITSSVISPAVRILPSVIASIIILSFCAFQEPKLTLILFLVLSFYYLMALVGTRNITGRISIQLSELISKRFRSIRALIQNRSFFRDNTSSTKLYQKLENDTIPLSSVDALGQVIAQSPRKGLEAIIFIALIAGVYIAEGRVQENANTLSIMVVLALKVLPNFQAIYQSIQQIKNNLSAYLEASKYFDEDNIRKTVKPQNTKSISLLKDKIEIKDLEVSYSKEQIIYPNTSFDLNKLNIIIGPSGCGKSTLLKALAQQISYSGKIEVPSDLSPQKFVYYGQKQTLLPGTLMENLLPFVNADIDLSKLNEVLEKFQVTQFLRENNLTLDSQLLLKGNKDLSDGQKQRILLARTFLTEADLILLDEPTSNLDQKNAQIVINAIRNSCKNNNIIMTSHNLKYFDRNDNFLKLG